jgi:hypothetical protein
VGWPLVLDTILSVQVIFIPNRLGSCDNDVWGDWVYGIDDKVAGVSGVGRQRVLTPDSAGDDRQKMPRHVRSENWVQLPAAPRSAVRTKWRRVVRQPMRHHLLVTSESH